MVRNRRRTDVRTPRSRGVVAVGRRIRKHAPGNNSKSNVRRLTGEKTKKKRAPTPTLADVPQGIRAKVADIRRRYRSWGQQGNSIAASSIIAACRKNKDVVQVVINAMLRKPIHKQLRDTIRKQL